MKFKRKHSQRDEEIEDLQESLLWKDEQMKRQEGIIKVLAKEIEEQKVLLEKKDRIIEAGDGVFEEMEQAILDLQVELLLSDDYDPTPDEEGEPPITWKERASQERPR